jgi:hypothetical protein
VFIKNSDQELKSLGEQDVEEKPAMQKLTYEYMKIEDL